MLIISALTTLASCAFMGAKLVEIKKENALLCEHEYNRSAVTKAPTCTENGVKTYFCDICGNEKKEVLPANGHIEETIVGQAAECEIDGLTDGIICSVCDTVLKGQETIPAIGHDYKPETAITMSCMEDGKINHICGNCGKIILETVEASGHNYVDGVCTYCQESITVNNLENVSESTDWIKELEVAEKAYTYKKVEFNGVEGQVLTKGIAYEDMVAEYVVIPCIKEQCGDITSYRYATNFYENYKSYARSIGYLASECLNNYALEKETYTKAQVTHLNNYIDEIVDFAYGLPMPIYDGSTFNFEQNENGEVIIDDNDIQINEDGDVLFTIPFGKNLSWLHEDLKDWSFSANVLLDVDKTDKVFSFGGLNENGAYAKVSGEEFKGLFGQAGLELCLFGVRFVVGINVDLNG